MFEPLLMKKWSKVGWSSKTQTWRIPHAYSNLQRQPLWVPHIHFFEFLDRGPRPSQPCRKSQAISLGQTAAWTPEFVSWPLQNHNCKNMGLREYSSGGTKLRTHFCHLTKQRAEVPLPDIPTMASTSYTSSGSVFTWQSGLAHLEVELLAVTDFFLLDGDTVEVGLGMDIFLMGNVALLSLEETQCKS